MSFSDKGIEFGPTVRERAHLSSIDIVEITQDEWGTVLKNLHMQKNTESELVPYRSSPATMFVPSMHAGVCY